jgi:hypothetical protein
LGEGKSRLRIAAARNLVQHCAMKLVALAAAAALVFPQIASAASPKKGAKLEGMEYLKARHIILGYGWTPFSGNCSGPDVSNRTCASYPEVGNCTGVGVGLCDMTFVRRNRCLELVTIGGAPQDKPGDTVVRDVTFRHAPCPKNPAY